MNLADVRVRKARATELDKIVALVRNERDVFGFVPRAAFEVALKRSEIIVATSGRNIIGVMRYHNRKDRVAVVHELLVNKEHRSRGIGSLLISTLSEKCFRSGQTLFRLKCPVELPANGFYARLGFSRVGIREGRRRPLAIWERHLGAQQDTSKPSCTFFITLTNNPKAVRDLVTLWDKGGDARNPFEHVVFTPLFSSDSTKAEIWRLKKERGSTVMFDSGGYQVQMGKATYEELFDRLRRFYGENAWADLYVLPDHVPHSSDNDREVDFKVRETLDFARLFLRMMPERFREKAVGVVHGRTHEQVRRCVEDYRNMGIRYLGFGSFGTSGPKLAVNLVSRESLRLLRTLEALTKEHKLRLHIFGIGSPSHLFRLVKAGVMPTSFDSAGWWKAGGFGNIFFPGGRQRQITAMPATETTMERIKREKKRSRHHCPFCSDLKLLRGSRLKRVVHNLAAMLDTVEQIRET